MIRMTYLVSAMISLAFSVTAIANDTKSASAPEGYHPFEIGNENVLVEGDGYAQGFEIVHKFDADTRYDAFRALAIDPDTNSASCTLKYTDPAVILPGTEMLQMTFFVSVAVEADNGGCKMEIKDARGDVKATIDYVYGTSY